MLYFIDLVITKTNHNMSIWYNRGSIEEPKREAGELWVISFERLYCNHETAKPGARAER